MWQRGQECTRRPSQLESWTTSTKKRLARGRENMQSSTSRCAMNSKRPLDLLGKETTPRRLRLNLQRAHFKIGASHYRGTLCSFSVSISSYCHNGHFRRFPLPPPQMEFVHSLNRQKAAPSVRGTQSGSAAAAIAAILGGSPALPTQRSTASTAAAVISSVKTSQDVVDAAAKPVLAPIQ